MRDAARKAVALAGGRTRAQVEADEVGPLALARLLEIVGEAAGKVSPEYRAAHPEFPWAEMSGLQNRLAHAYLDVDLDVLLGVVAKDLPPLVALLVRALGERHLARGVPGHGRRAQSLM